MAEKVYMREEEYKLSWSGLFAGAIIAVVFELLLVALGMGVGVGLAGKAGVPAGTVEFGTAAGLWLGISSIISLFVGSWVAGRLSHPYGNRAFLGTVEGLTVWGMTMIFSFLVLSFASAATLKGMTGAAAPGAVSTASIWTFIIMLLDAASSAIGGITGLRMVPSVTRVEEEKREFPRAA